MVCFVFTLGVGFYNNGSNWEGWLSPETILDLM
jgi:hypothetical protein